MNASKGKEKRNRGLLGKLTPSRRRRTKGKATKIEHNVDEEAGMINATEKDALIPQTTKRSGKALWDHLREQKDEIAFAPSLALEEEEEEEEEDTSESVKLRKSRHADEIRNEFRSDLEFSLWHCLAAICLYFCIAVLAYSFVFEQWSIIDSIYFAVVTFSTTGYGDVVPTSDASRIFTAFFALSGVACLGVALGVLGSNLVEAQTKAMDQASELSRRQVMSLFDSDESHESNDEMPSKPWYRSKFLCHVLFVFGLLFACCWLLGNESGWDVATTFYFSVITATTVGFGDFAPETQLGRLFAVPVILLAVGIMGVWLGQVADAIVKRRQAAFHQRLKRKELTIADLEVMDADEDGKVTLAEYLAFMLVSMNKVEQELIDELTQQFGRLDADGSGLLEKQDLIIVAKEKLKNSAKRKLELAEYKQKLLRLGGSQQEEKQSTTSFMAAIRSQLHDESNHSSY